MLKVSKLFAGLISVVSMSLLSLPVFALTDGEITDAVKSRISTNATTTQSNIDVTTRQGVVYLSGKLETDGEASSAVEAAYSVPDVRDVNTETLLVRTSVDPYSDSYITAKVRGIFVREELFGDRPIDVSGVSIETVNGVVTLTGTTDNFEQIKTAISLAKSVDGVKDVKSTLVVKN